MSKIISSLVVKIGADLTEFQKGMSKASKELKSFGKTMDSVGSTLTKGITVPVVAAISGLTALSVKAASAADELITMSNKTGVSVKNLQELQYAARFVDVEVETMTGSMVKLTRSMDAARDGADTQIKAFRQLNVQYQNADGTLRNAKDVWVDVIDALGRVASEADRDALALELFGRSAAELNPLIKAGSGELARLAEEAQKTGAIIADEDVAALGELDDELQRMKAQLSVAGAELAVSFAPALKALAPVLKDTVVPAIQTLAEILKELLEEYNSLSPGMQKFVLSLGVAAVAAGPVATGVGKMAKGLGTLTSWLAKAAKPVAGIGSAATAATGSVGGLGAALSALSGPLVAVAAGLAAIMVAKHYVNKEIAAMEAAVEVNATAVEAAAERAKTKIAEQHKVRMDSLAEEMSAEEGAYLQRTQAIQDEYAAQVKASGKTEAALKKSLAKRQSDLNKAHDEAIRAIQEEYGVFESKQKSRTDIVQEEADAQKDIIQEVLDLSRDIATQEGKAFGKTYDAILKKASAVHDEKMRMYTQEYLAAVKLINKDLAAKVNGYQKEIDKLEDKTEEEDRLETEQANKQKILDLEYARDHATSMRERRDAEQDLANEINRQNRDKERINRQIQIDSLNRQIQTAVAKAEEDKANALEILTEKTGEQQVIIDAATQHNIDQIQAERIAKENAENAKYEAAKATLDAEEEALDGYGESYGAKLDAELQQKLQLEADKLQATKDRLQAELDEEQKQMEEEQRRYDAITERMRREMAGETTHSSSSGSTFGGGGRSFVSGAGRGIPGYASGIASAPGGYARVNERGGEIQYLPKGTAVIPNDISRQIAASVGSSMGDAETHSLLRQLVDADRAANITVKVGERELRDIIVDTIRAHERQTGRPL